MVEAVAAKAEEAGEAAAAAKARAPRIILLGPPASCKGKMSELILETYRLEHIHSGLALREASQADTVLGKEIQAAVKARTTVSDHLTVEAIKNKVTSADVVKSGFLLDSYPRTAVQAKLLLDEGVPIDRVISLHSAPESLVEKLSAQWIDPETHTVYGN